MDDLVHLLDIASIHNCCNCSMSCKSMKDVRHIYWGLHRNFFRNISEAFHETTELEWRGDDSSHECNKHHTDRYTPGSCNNTLCDIMSPTPTQWFEISSTWRMTDFSCSIHKYLNFNPFASVTETNTYKPTRLLCVNTCRIVDGTEANAYFTVSHVWSSWNFVVANRELSRGSKGYPWLERMSKLLGIGHAWIDTCCIIQDDVADKERELGKMGDYYRNAQACAVLHSVDVADVDDFVNSIRILSTNATSFVRPAHTWALACIRYSKLLTEPWFTRVWTVQEAVLSKRLVIDSSCVLVDLKELLRCYNVIVTRIGGIPMCDDRGTVWKLSEFIDVGFMDMTTILKLCANRQATVKHDYVYGIIGMLPRIKIPISYEIHPQQLVISLFKLLIQHGDILWLSWIGQSCIGRRRDSWIPTIGSYLMFAEWNNGIALRHGRRIGLHGYNSGIYHDFVDTYSRNLMDIFCLDIRVEILGGSMSNEMYTTNFQPIVTLCDLSHNCNKCIGCIVEMFCKLGCCRSWIIVEMARKIGQTHFVVCDDCLSQQPDSVNHISCQQHISRTFNRKLGSYLWLTKSKTDDMYVLVLAVKPHELLCDNILDEQHLLYGKRVERIIASMQGTGVFVSGNFGWLVSNAMERIGVVVACSKAFAVSDEYISV